MKRVELPKWNNKNLFEKILHVIGLIVAFIIILFAFLQIFNIFKSIDIFEILLAILMFIQAMQYWKYDKKIGMFNLLAAIIISICGIIIIFL